MNPYLSLIRKRKFWIPFLLLVGFDLCLQTGAYRPFLKKGSYAANVVRLTEIPIEKKSELEPTVLVLGTSVAYQGLSMKILNDALEPYGEKIQSIAVPGTELLVQNLIVQKVLPKFPKVHTVIHVFEVSTPWVNQTELHLATLAMLGELDRISAIQKIYQYKYNVRYDDIAYLLSKSLAYRRDFRDFFLDPSKRLKDIGRAKKEQNKSPWAYENQYSEMISMYPKAQDVQSCLATTDIRNNEPIPAGSDRHHKKAIWDTCDLAAHTPTVVTYNPVVQAYFERLGYLYKDIRSIGKSNGQNIRIIGVLAPYSEIIKSWRSPERDRIWKEELSKLSSDGEFKLLDYQGILDGGKNGDYYYDLIHLNRPGMLEFSDALAKDLPSALSLGVKRKP
ncbi:hypothetical protein CH373_06770 [Leptospira perolatii]|uniref:SGNH/GDSL hydrolase family protein n=1 Tax=Leptospira perolatii TaxID=2023191 RepID=A0A2M9ZPF5_9LEPT|nr:hypothetical protein [Leptospira perolatii]PJZ70638.1 hypothetical protein CH360_03630 [Leptospira perolatii]PJZ73849.1 hypothetical protein CH373_06770 [Leptospira perolatii]